MARVVNAVESIARVTTTSTSAQNGLAYTFTPTANKAYLIVAAGLMDVSSSGQLGTVQLTDGTTTCSRVLKPSSAEATNSKKGWAAAMYIASSGSPTSKTHTIQYFSGIGTSTLGLSDQRITAIELGANDIADFVYGAATQTSATYSVRKSITLTSTAQYLLLASGAFGVTSGTSTGGGGIKAVAGSTTFGDAVTLRTNVSGQAVNYGSWLTAYLYAATAGDAFTAQWASDGTMTCGCKDVVLVALYVPDLPLLLSNEDRSETSTTGSSAVTKATITFTAGAGDYLLIGTALMRGVNSSATAAMGRVSPVIDGSADTQDQEAWVTSSVNSFAMFANLRKETLTAGSKTRALANSSSNANLTAYVSEAGIYAIQLFDDMAATRRGPFAPDHRAASAFQPMTWGV